MCTKISFKGEYRPWAGGGRRGNLTLEARAEDKLIYTLPYEEEEDRVCKVKCPKGVGAVVMDQLLYCFVNFNGLITLSKPYFFTH